MFEASPTSTAVRQPLWMNQWALAIVILYKRYEIAFQYCSWTPLKHRIGADANLLGAFPLKKRLIANPISNLTHCNKQKKMLNIFTPKWLFDELHSFNFNHAWVKKCRTHAVPYCKDTAGSNTNWGCTDEIAKSSKQLSTPVWAFSRHPTSECCGKSIPSNEEQHYSPYFGNAVFST